MMASFDESPLSEEEKAFIDKGILFDSSDEEGEGGEGRNDDPLGYFNGADGKEEASFDDAEDLPSLGGSFLSEKIDDLYEAFVVNLSFFDKEDVAEVGSKKAHLMKLIKGLHQRPDVVSQTQMAL